MNVEEELADMRSNTTVTEEAIADLAEKVRVLADVVDEEQKERRQLAGIITTMRADIGVIDKQLRMLRLSVGGHATRIGKLDDYGDTAKCGKDWGGGEFMDSEEELAYLRPNTAATKEETPGLAEKVGALADALDAPESNDYDFTAMKPESVCPTCKEQVIPQETDDPSLSRCPSCSCRVDATLFKTPDAPEIPQHTQTEYDRQEDEIDRLKHEMEMDKSTLDELSDKYFNNRTDFKALKTKNEKLQADLDYARDIIRQGALSDKDST